MFPYRVLGSAGNTKKPGYLAGQPGDQFARGVQFPAYLACGQSVKIAVAPTVARQFVSRGGDSLDRFRMFVPHVTHDKKSGRHMVAFKHSQKAGGRRGARTVVKRQRHVLWRRFERKGLGGSTGPLNRKDERAEKQEDAAERGSFQRNPNAAEKIER